TLLVVDDDSGLCTMLVEYLTLEGFNLLIEAFYRHQRAGGRFGRLVIVGDGPQRPQLQAQLATLGLADAVALPGYVEGPDRLLEQAAGFVMSSLTEGMPMALLEAIQWPRPVLATSVGEIPQILQGSPRAVLVAPNSVDELVGGLERLQSLPPTAPARDDLAARYTAERMALEYDAAYRDAVHGS
ncbi:MAG TPA: glycosyltransferase, partial [Steroidobacteraceae bacterium]|nr:glycosyltransferase [Steroidobacteraceae bacterium]